MISARIDKSATRAEETLFDEQAERPRRAREAVRVWLRLELNRLAEIDLDVSLERLCRQAATEFRTQPDWVDRLLTEDLEWIIGQMAKGWFHGRRGTLVRGDRNDPARLSDGAVHRLERWYEHVDDRYIRLVDMRQSELRASVQERRKQLDGELRRIQLLERLADELEPEERVRDHWSLEALATIVAEYEPQR